MFDGLATGVGLNEDLIEFECERVAALADPPGDPSVTANEYRRAAAATQQTNGPGRQPPIAGGQTGLMALQKVLKTSVTRSPVASVKSETDGAFWKSDHCDSTTSVAKQAVGRVSSRSARTT
jgi:hypothetical protein